MGQFLKERVFFSVMSSLRGVIHLSPTIPVLCGVLPPSPMAFLVFVAAKVTRHLLCPKLLIYSKIVQFFALKPMHIECSEDAL